MPRSLWDLFNNKSIERRFLRARDWDLRRFLQEVRGLRGSFSLIKSLSSKELLSRSANLRASLFSLKRCCVCAMPLSKISFLFLFSSRVNKIKLKLESQFLSNQTAFLSTYLSKSFPEYILKWFPEYSFQFIFFLYKS